MNNESDPKNDTGSGDEKAPTFLQTVSSVSASFFGVQNHKNRERDFKHGNAKTFIFVGVAMTAVFILTLVVAVKFALKAAGV